jgi:hypothetical protein
MQTINLSATLKKVGDLIRIHLEDDDLGPLSIVEMQTVKERTWTTSSKIGKWPEFVQSLVYHLFRALRTGDEYPDLIVTPSYVYFPFEEKEGVVSYESKVIGALQEAISSVCIKATVALEPEDSEANTK